MASGLGLMAAAAGQEIFHGVSLRAQPAVAPAASRVPPGSMCAARSAAAVACTWLRIAARAA